jgi:hypothetical protein
MTQALNTMTPRAAAAKIAAAADPDWTRQFVDELDRAVRTDPLERFVELWGLSNSAAASVFGVSRQAFSKWLKTGVPTARADAVADLAAATDLLDRYVKRERIPAVIRRPAPVLGNNSLLDLASDGETRRVAEAVEQMFDLRRVQP